MIAGGGSAQGHRPRQVEMQLSLEDQQAMEAAGAPAEAAEPEK